jgi:type IV pilus assembly protein PilY1
VTDKIASFGAGVSAGTATTAIGNISPDALGFALNGPGYAYTPNNGTGTLYLDPPTARNMILSFTLGQPATSFVGPGTFTFQARAPSVFGDIYHSSPVVVGPPGSLIEDPSYQAFRNLCATGGCGTAPTTNCSTSGSTSSGTSAQQRPTVVYAATNDGLLHAFWADVPCNQTNPELWAMLLPASLPNLTANYPAGHQFLLDGAPVVKDVVWERSQTNEQASLSSSSSAGPTSLWHTTLVAGFGSQRRGYYAVDVTSTTPTLISGGSTVTPSTTTPPLGPALRWQMTTTGPPGTFQIFAQNSAKPAITTLSMDPGDGKGIREIGVAILPGGWDGAQTNQAQCPRASSQASTEPPGTFYQKRTSVRCWTPGNVAVNGRALAIVRLDTGELLRVFARGTDVPATSIDPGRVIDTPLDSPITGTPMVYPTDVGSVATKVFVADADGTIWRFDLSSTSPANWKGTVFLDLYNQTADTDLQNSWSHGQPLQVDPVLSLDSSARLVLNMATGTTDTFDNSGEYFVYSVTEQPNSTNGFGVNANVNWYLSALSQLPGSMTQSSKLRQGERVSGPMTVFNGTLYFATYWAGDPTQQICSNGDARIWGMDFVAPEGGPCSDNTCQANGGVRSTQLDSTNVPSTGFTDVGLQFPGRVVPGVAVQATPACGAFNPTTDPYTGTGHKQLGQLQSPPVYQLVGMVGGISTGGVPVVKSVQLATPLAPTMIDSWASVLE